MTDVEMSGGVVADSPELRYKLIERIQARRVDIDAFLDRARPKGARLGVVSVISSALAATFTAGPALGGTSFADGAQTMFGFSTESAVWQLLCIGALVVSVVSVICTNLLRSQDTAARISSAEAANAELAGLQTMLEFGELRLEPAVKLYQQCVLKVAFIDEQLAPARKG
jgi:exonuclease VII small subunit